MAYEVITHGGGDGLVPTFNAIAAMFNGTKGFGSSLVYIGGSFATAMAVMTLVVKQELLPSVKWFLGSLLMMMALMLPKVDIIVKDRISGLAEPVAKVPFMLGAFAGIASQLGDIVAERFDSLFSSAGESVMDYRHHGVAMASQLAAKATGFTIPNPDAAANVRAFVQNCMVFDIAKGKYTIDELLNAPDTWEFLKIHASPIRGFPYRAGKKQAEILTCRQAVSGSHDAWKTYVQDAAKRYGPELFPYSRRPAVELLSNLEASYQYLTGLSVDATAILKQNMMRNAIHDGLLELNQIHDSSAAITAYAVSRAQAQQKTAYALQGSMASLSLSTLKIVVEVLFYGMFPFIVAIAVFPGGLAIVKKYLIALFWIQSWAPMYSILNMLVNVYGKAKSVAAVTLADGSTKALAFSTIPRLGEANEWVSAVAGYAMMSVPFLSYGIIHYGAGALSQLATHFGSQTQSAASHAAEEATTGNYQLGNTSFDNHNRSNVNAFKYDTNTSVAAGKSSVQELDGSTSHRMADGSHTINRDPALSKLGATLNVSEGMSSNLSEGAELSHRAGMQFNDQAIDGRVAALNQFKEARENRAHDTSSGETFTTNESVMQDSGISKNSRIAEDLEKRFGVSKELAGRIVGGMKIEAGGGANLGIIKAGVYTYAQAEGSFTKIGSEKLDEAIRYTKDEGASENWKQAETEAKEGRYSTLDSENKSFGKAISASLNESIAQQKMATASFNEEQAYRKSAQILENKGVQFNQDMSQEFFNNLIKNHDPDEAKRIVSNPELLRKHASKWIQSQAETLKENIKAQGLSFNPEDVKQQYGKNVQMVEGGNTPDSAFNNYQNTVFVNTDPKLNQSIDTQAKDKVANKTAEVRAIIEEEKLIINRQKEQLEKEGKKFK